ncbi:hypothetical protein LR48_Vigan08g089200 [Vigna angularis]|uniref:Uncharacterized protein n=1 Tax=Phaseolus angularis TaxID=3914 RepID=A0A0L9V4R3_PHAAN|nr:hypothetical protein LR48_Vigan08g089200 [Vigna angularis]
MAPVIFADRHRFLNRGIFRRDSHHHHEHQNNPNLTTTTTTITAATIDAPPPLALPSRGDALVGDFGAVVFRARPRERRSERASQRERESQRDNDGAERAREARPRGGRRDRGRRDRGEGGKSEGREARAREARAREARARRGESDQGARFSFNLGKKCGKIRGLYASVLLGPEVVEAYTPRSFLPTDAVYPFHLGFLLIASETVSETTN